MAVFLAPTFGDGYQAFDTVGAPLNGGFIYTYQAGTTTPQPTYTTATGNVANANPIVCGTDGRPQIAGAIVEIWLTAGVSYKFVLTDSLNNTIATYDNLSGINDIAAASGGISEWVATGLTPTFISTTSFSLVGNQTANFPVGIRTKTTNTGGTIYSNVYSTSYAAGPNTTTIVVSNDSGVIDSGISAVSYSILRSDSESLPPFNTLLPVLADSTDPTKRVKFAISGVSTATVRTVQIQNRDGVIATLSDLVPRTMANVGLAISMGGNAVTISLKQQDGVSDPTSGNPCAFAARSTTTAGDVNTFTVTQAQTGTIASGATLGTTSGVSSRVHIAELFFSGSGEFAWMHGVTGVASRNPSITRIDESNPITTVAASGASNSAGVWYSTTQRTNAPFCYVGYFDSLQTVAGTWGAQPTRIMVNPSRKPGDIVQRLRSTVTNVVTCAGVIAASNVIPQATSGTAVTNITITPTSPSNIISVGFLCNAAGSTNILIMSAILVQDTNANAIAGAFVAGGSTNTEVQLKLEHEFVGNTQATTMNIRCGPVSNTMYINSADTSGTGLFGGISATRETVDEISV